MKRLLSLVVAGAVGVAVMGQDATVVPIIPRDGLDPFRPIPGMEYQDRSVKVLGNVRNGPPLAPMPPVAYIPENPPAVLFPPWGPRAYASSGRMLNFSFRGLVGKGDQVAVGGFVVSEGNRVMLIRAVGPTLASYGLAGVLARPQLELLDSAGRRIAVAVPWSETSLDTQDELRTAATEVGAFALRQGSQDQVLLVFLERGSYSVVVSGTDGTTGLVLLEGYEVPRAKSGGDSG